MFEVLSLVRNRLIEKGMKCCLCNKLASKMPYGARCSSVVRAFTHGAMGRRIDPSWGVNSLSYFSFQPVLHDWCNKGRGMCYPVCVDGAYKRTVAVNRKE